MEFPAIDPVAFSLGPLVVRWYALAYLAGFILGWRYALRLASEKEEIRPNKTDTDDFLVWVIPAVILGGRLGYVLFYNFPYYSENPTEILMIWRGGMSFHGGILGVAVVMIVYARIHKFPVLRLSDIVCAVAPIGLLFGRIANFINGELYGRVTDAPWGIIFPQSDGLPRHPSQLYEAFLEGLVIIFVMIIFAKMGIQKRFPGLMTGTFLCLYGLFRYLVEFVREPDAQIGLLFEFISMGQVLCLPMILAGIGFIIYAVQKRDGLQK
jgi:phosphatidylglycerol:prolipoprotein diacylglycerol transferase